MAGSGKSISGPLQSYLSTLSTGSQSTLVSAARQIAMMVSGGTCNDPHQFEWHRLTYDDIIELQARLRKQKSAPRQINKYLVLVRGVLRACYNSGLISSDTLQRALNVRSAKIQDLPSGRALTSDEVTRLLQPAVWDSLSTVRDTALVALMVGAGLRRNEAVTVTLDGYTPDTGSLRIRGKGNKERMTALRPAAKHVFDQWVAHVRRQWGSAYAGPVFTLDGVKAMSVQTATDVLQRVITRTGVAACTPHDLRRTFVTQLLEDGVDPMRVARIVGHADPSTTMLYDRRTTADDLAVITGKK